MSRLPQYQPIPNTPDTEDDPPPWTKSGANDQRARDRDRDSTESESTPYGDTLYPPGPPGPSGLSGLSLSGPPGRAADGNAATVTFTFQPRWPTGGTQSSVMGTIGETRESTIAMLRRSFPVLRDHPVDQIEFLAPCPPPSNFAEILDEAWPRFVSSPPEHLWVRVIDGPGVKQARNRRGNIKCAAVTCAIIAVFPTILIIGFLLSKLFGSGSGSSSKH
ncbi:hypothetical protein JCM24511_06232 [Saitozyma sp. JCM 24511]|nr:hypothetical protein JCM24511_06232 [Saitozyma sp. JCM 24511]